MKKLMIVAAAAFGMAAFGDIESSNIVGYAGGPNTVEGFNFAAVGFNTIGCNTFDIQQVRIGDGGAGTIGWGGEVFSLWAGGPDVVDGSAYFYYDSSMDPAGEATDFYWGDDEGNKVSFSVAAGQGVVIECGEGLSVSSAGEVPNESAEMTTVEGFNFVSNPFPVELDIQQIKVDDGGAGDIGWGGEVFSIWAGGPDVVDGSAYFYYDSSMDPTGEATGFYWGDDEGNKVSYSVAIGQSVVIECSAGLSVTIAPSYVK